MDMLHDPLLNKGTAFSREERLNLGILGLLPPRVSTPEQQASRVLQNLRRRAAPIEKYIDMLSLLDRNTSLFYQVVCAHIEEILPIIYTPTVGEGCQRYAHIFRRSRGIFITRHEKGMIRQVLENWPHKDVRVIVVTDGERILGLGDLGANGMGIPVGKLSLYTACGGVPPEQTLPVMLDVGTNNQALLDDGLYLGTCERRLEGRDYDELVAEFMAAAAAVFPKALIQFEDFANHNAFRLLAAYRDKACCFNDDIQGTAAVALAGLYSAASITGVPVSRRTLLFHGAGEAAIGIADLVVRAMTAEGLSLEEARGRCRFMDSRGLVESGRADLQEHKRPYAHAGKPLRGLLEAVRELKPSALIGVSGKKAQFTREIVEEMASLNDRPLIFALSNPTSNSECTAEQAYAWSRGSAVFASGSPFDPVSFQGRTFVPGQANNVYIFPGVGMGAIACGARRITDEMFLEAARTLASCAGPEDIKAGCLFPPISRIKEVSNRIAAAVAQVAYARGLAKEPRPADILAQIQARQYRPQYSSYF
ncbi:MAG: NAD-dependent malic enzyme [Elusimicrobia bacterium]|nr:NAD-dependent malic enzyme [Elusimicrobiota bacterium]